MGLACGVAHGRDDRVTTGGKHMKVCGHEVSEQHHAAAIERMQRGEFKAADIAQAMCDAGLPKHVTANGFVCYLSNRVADRIIQQQKKLGRIELLGGSRSRWSWVR